MLNYEKFFFLLGLITVSLEELLKMVEEQK